MQIMENVESHGILRISFSRPGRSWNLIIGARKSWKIKVLLGRLY